MASKKQLKALVRGFLDARVPGSIPVKRQQLLAVLQHMASIELSPRDWVKALETKESGSTKGQDGLAASVCRILLLLLRGAGSSHGGSRRGSEPGWREYTLLLDLLLACGVASHEPGTDEAACEAAACIDTAQQVQQLLFQPHTDSSGGGGGSGSAATHTNAVMESGIYLLHMLVQCSRDAARWMCGSEAAMWPSLLHHCLLPPVSPAATQAASELIDTMQRETGRQVAAMVSKDVAVEGMVFLISFATMQHLAKLEHALCWYAAYSHGGQQLTSMLRMAVKPFAIVGGFILTGNFDMSEVQHALLVGAPRLLPAACSLLRDEVGDQGHQDSGERCNHLVTILEHSLQVLHGVSNCHRPVRHARAAALRVLGKAAYLLRSTWPTVAVNACCSIRDTLYWFLFGLRVPSTADPKQELPAADEYDTHRLLAGGHALNDSDVAIPLRMLVPMAAWMGEAKDALLLAVCLMGMVNGVVPAIDQSTQGAGGQPGRGRDGAALSTRATVVLRQPRVSAMFEALELPELLMAARNVHLPSIHKEYVPLLTAAIRCDKLPWRDALKHG